jgi:Zn-finger nucleic acid-binding protein
MVRICPHCDVRLENVRCQRCFSLQAPGTFACVRCGHALELEPLLDATDAPCPRCNHPLEASPGGDTHVHECPRCGGMFVARDALAEILCGAEIGGALREGASRLTRSPEREVRYVPCPLCHATMNRVNFGKVSGVIVDVCKVHGTWFDAGELTRTVAFAAAGGLERTRARELEESRTEASRARADRAQAQLGAVLEVRAPNDVRLDAWRELLTRILSR